MKIKQTVMGALSATVFALVINVGLITPAEATFTCNQDSGVCTDDSVADTPLGQVQVSASESNVVTVHLTPLYPRTVVVGIARSHPPSPIRSGVVRTSVATTGGTVDIDTIHRGSANVAIISIHPPSPCRAVTRGSTVVFTPRFR
jgi:hypothetical protein